MDPSRTKKSPSRTSRRSSILKAPKPRQPLQNVEFNNSSNESSPVTSKLKRRVSFAEKKHVKEFCDSVEQGTVWDQTYEENDLSISKLANTPQADNNKIECLSSRSDNGNACQVNEQDKRTINVHYCEQISLFQDDTNNTVSKEMLDTADNELDLTNTVSGILSIDTIQQRINPTQITAQFSISDKENINFMYLQELHTENDYMEITQAVSGGFQGEHGNVIDQNDRRNEEETVNKSRLGPQMTFRDAQNTLQEDENLANVSMELTTFVPASSRFLELRQDNTECNKPEICEKTSMGSIIIIKHKNNLLPINPNNTENGPYEIDDNKTSCQNISMDITRSIQYFPYEKENILENNKTQSMDISMEITEAIPTHTLSTKVFYETECEKQNMTKIFQNESVEMTQAVGASNYSKCILEEKTKIFEDDPIAVTEMIPPSFLPSLITRIQSDVHEEINERHINKTQIFHDEAIEITEAVAGANCRKSSFEDKTRIFHDDPIAFTEVVPASYLSSLRNAQSVPSNHLHEIYADRTNVFYDEPMTITEVVPTNYLSSSKTYDKHALKETANTHEVSMEMTRPVSKFFGSRSQKHARRSVCPQTCGSVDTDNMGNVSMEMTRAISTVVPITNNDQGLMKELVKMSEITNETQCLIIQQNDSPVLESTADPISFKLHEESLKEYTAPLVETTHENAIPSENLFLECTPVAQKLEEHTLREAYTKSLAFTNTCRSVDDKTDMENLEPVGVNDSEIQECNLMKTFIDDNIEELEAIEPPSFVYSEHSTENSFDHEARINEIDYEKYDDEPALQEMKELNLRQPSQIVDAWLSRDPTENINNVSTETKTMDISDVGNTNVQEQSSLMENSVTRNTISEEHFKTEDFAFMQDPYRSLLSRIKMVAKRDDCIWDLYQENAEKKIFGIGFMSASLIVVIYLADSDSDIAIQTTKEIKVISRLEDDGDVFVRIVHKILLEKLKPAEFMQQFGNSEVLLMLEYISREVKSTMDFMFELQKLDDRCLMDISTDRIMFVSHTNKMDIILKVTIKVKPFDKISPDDITISHLLGSVSDNEIKKLITNIKKDHKFLRRYMSDVKHYIELMEESIIT